MCMRLLRHPVAVLAALVALQVSAASRPTIRVTRRLRAERAALSAAALTSAAWVNRVVSGYDPDGGRSPATR